MKPLIDLIRPPDSSPQSINHSIKEAHISQRMRRKLRRDGHITINGQSATWNALVQPGDRLIISLPPEQDLEPYPLDLSIVFEDDYLVVVNKPAGLLMHPTANERTKTLANALAYYYMVSGQNYDFHPVHRLDKDTSGLVIIAKTAVVQHAFEKQGSRFQKTYDALIRGHLPSSASLHWPIARKEGSIIERCVHSQGKEAHTDISLIRHYSPKIKIESWESNQPLPQASIPYSHVTCLLHTGRTHQIRVHLAHLGYPLLGDDIYGGTLDLIPRQALHASKLSFIHPITKEVLHLQGSMPDDMTDLLEDKG